MGGGSYDVDEGIIPRVINELYNGIVDRSDDEFEVKVSYLEVRTIILKSYFKTRDLNLFLSKNNINFIFQIQYIILVEGVGSIDFLSDHNNICINCFQCICISTS